jgi:hypothetical protein
MTFFIGGDVCGHRLILLQLFPHKMVRRNLKCKSCKSAGFFRIADFSTLSREQGKVDVLPLCDGNEHHRSLSVVQE